MSFISHLNHLHEKHTKLESLIQEAYISHLPDEEVRRLKKEKLHLKEEIAQLELQQMQGQLPHRHAA